MKKIFYILALFLLLAACSNKEEHAIYSEQYSAEIEQVLNGNKQIKGYKSITDNNDILVAIDIRRWSRFNREKIEKKITKQLEDKLPDKEVLVTGDLKIRWEIEKIIREEKQNEDLKKSVDQIKSLSKEET